jgi:hypothetical protein
VEVEKAMREYGILVHQQIIWVKNQPDPGKSQLIARGPHSVHNNTLAQKPSPAQNPYFSPARNHCEFACPKLISTATQKEVFWDERFDRVPFVWLRVKQALHSFPKSLRSPN